MKHRGILYVFPIFQPAFLEQKLRCSAADDLFRVSLVSCAGSKLSCFPRQETIADKTGIGISSAQKHLKILEQRKLIEVSKHHKPYGYPNNKYTLLSLDNPEVYRDLAPQEVDELPLYIGGDFRAS